MHAGENLSLSRSRSASVLQNLPPIKEPAPPIKTGVVREIEEGAWHLSLLP